MRARCANLVASGCGSAASPHIITATPPRPPLHGPPTPVSYSGRPPLHGPSHVRPLRPVARAEAAAPPRRAPQQQPLPSVRVLNKSCFVARSAIVAQHCSLASVTSDCNLREQYDQVRAYLPCPFASTARTYVKPGGSSTPASLQRCLRAMPRNPMFRHTTRNVGTQTQTLSLGTMARSA